MEGEEESEKGGETESVAEGLNEEDSLPVEADGKGSLHPHNGVDTLAYMGKTGARASKNVDKPPLRTALNDRCPCTIP